MKKLSAAILIIATVLLVSSCRAEPINIPERISTPIDPATVATISGRVEFAGEIPQPVSIPMGGFPGCVTRHVGFPQDASVLVEDGRLQNVFVFIREGLEGKVFPVPTEPVVFDQQGCIYKPRVLGVQRYQRIAVLNSDTLLHNVHAVPVNQQGFNFGQPVAGMENIVQFKEEEVMVPVKCDVHGWMKAYIGVVDHPYFDVTPEDGSFQIGNVPPGSYTLQIWHEIFGVQMAEVTVGDSDEVIVNFRFPL